MQFCMQHHSQGPETLCRTCTHFLSSTTSHTKSSQTQQGFKIRNGYGISKYVLKKFYYFYSGLQLHFFQRRIPLCGQRSQLNTTYPLSIFACSIVTRLKTSATTPWSLLSLVNFLFKAVFWDLLILNVCQGPCSHKEGHHSHQTTAAGDMQRSVAIKAASVYICIGLKTKVSCMHANCTFKKRHLLVRAWWRLINIPVS